MQRGTAQGLLDTHHASQVVKGKTCQGPPIPIGGSGMNIAGCLSGSNRSPRPRTATFKATWTYNAVHYAAVQTITTYVSSGRRRSCHLLERTEDVTWPAVVQTRRRLVPLALGGSERGLGA